MKGHLFDGLSRLASVLKIDIMIRRFAVSFLLSTKNYRLSTPTFSNFPFSYHLKIDMTEVDCQKTFFLFGSFSTTFPTQNIHVMSALPTPD